MALTISPGASCRWLTAGRGHSRARGGTLPLRDREHTASTRERAVARESAALTVELAGAVTGLVSFKRDGAWRDAVVYGLLRG
jgi:hypothetical protein